jgi:hypothetical protein
MTVAALAIPTGVLRDPLSLDLAPEHTYGHACNTQRVIRGAA